MRRAKSDAVTKIGKIGDKYLLTEIEQPNKGAKSKSPSRTGAGKSPSRNEGFKSPNTKSKSPARKSPARKSPARKSPARKSPSRKSPARSETLVNTPKSDSKPKSKTTARRQSRSPARNKGTASGDQKNAIQKTKTASKKGKIDNDELKLKKTIFDESDSDVEVVQNVKVKTPSRSSSRKIDVEGDSFKDINWKIDSNNYSSITRRTVLGHDRELHEIKNYDYLAKKLTELSDDDDIVSQNRKSLSRERAVEEYEIIEFGGCLGTSLLTILVPFGAIALHICCNEYQCTFNKLPSLGNYKKLATFFNLTTFLTHAAFLLILTLLSALPFGGKKIISLTTKQEKFEYRMNGLFCCFIILAVSIGLEVSRIPVFNFIYEHYFHFAITAIMFGLLLSIYAYIRSFYVPKNALNSNALDSSVYGFFMGRETNPRLFGIIDLKILCLRYLIIGTLMLNTAILYKSIGLISLANVKDVKTAFDLILPNLNSTLLVVYLTQTIYVIDSLMFEPAWLSSFEVRYEGFGYMVAMGYAVYPFLITSVTKYVYNYNVKLANWQLGIIAAVFLFGYILNRGSNNQKNKFRRNPYSPGVAYLESIPTSQGKKLLISGFWGFVRHPNYLGDIILNLSWYPFVLCAPPVTFILFTLLVLIHRASRDNTHCKIRYGPSWDRYCQKIKYKLIPKVY